MKLIDFLNEKGIFKAVPKSEIINRLFDGKIKIGDKVKFLHFSLKAGKWVSRKGTFRGIYKEPRGFTIIETLVFI